MYFTQSINWKEGVKRCMQGVTEGENSYLTVNQLMDLVHCYPLPALRLMKGKQETSWMHHERREKKKCDRERMTKNRALGGVSFSQCRAVWERKKKKKTTTTRRREVDARAWREEKEEEERKDKMTLVTARFGEFCCLVLFALPVRPPI